MIHVADTIPKKELALHFLRERGVLLHRSDDFQALVRISDVTQQIIGVVAFNGFCGNVCSVHLAGDGNWVSREFIRKVFDYPFRQLNLVAIVAPIAATNERALRFDKHFGMREVHRIKDGWEAGVDLILLEMRKEDCRYLEEENHELAEVA